MGYIDLNSACDYYVPHNTLYVKPQGKSIYCIFIFYDFTLFFIELHLDAVDVLKK